MHSYRVKFRKYDRGWIEKIIQKAFEKLHPEKLEALLADDEKVVTILKKKLDVLLEEFYKDLKKDGPSNLAAHRSVSNAFRKSHIRTWKKAIDKLEIFVFMNLEYHEKLFDAYKIERKNDTRFKVLMGLHGKAILTAFEILELIKGGFADGAMARWRSLYETAIIVNFLKDNNQELSQQFLDYSVIQEYKDAVEYQKNCDKLGYKPYTKKEMEKFENRKELMAQKYGPKFKKEYGWLINYLPEPFNFKCIEEKTKYSHFRPYYKLANHKIHSGPQSILFSLASINSRQWMPSGPSNFGLADPGKNTAIALLWTSTALAEFENYLETAIFIKLSTILMYEINDEFLDTQFCIEEDEKLYKKSNRKGKKGREA
jgi:hypothetical protein